MKKPKKETDADRARRVEINMLRLLMEKYPDKAAEIARVRAS